MYIITETTAPAVACDPAAVRAATHSFGNSPVVTIFTGRLRDNGNPCVAHRRPRGSNVYFRGMAMTLTDPVKIGNTTVFNVAGGRERLVVREIDLSPIVNGFEIKELPSGYVDCIAWDGTVISTHLSVHDATVWAMAECAPELDAAARAEMDALDAEFA